MADQFKRDERLLKVLAIVTDWLKFAETKNAMIIAFNGASIYGIAKALDLDFFKTNSLFYQYACIMILQLAFSGVVAIISFVPNLNLVSSKVILKINEPNSIFFEHLRYQKELSIMQMICETSDTDFTTFERDIASQIRQNSTIASKKYAYFKVAAWLTVSAYVSPFLAGIFGLLNFLHNKR